MCLIWRPSQKQRTRKYGDVVPAQNDHMFTVLMVLICSCRVAMLGLTLLMQLAMLSCVYMTGRWTLLPGAATSTSTVDLEESQDSLCMRNMPTTNSYHGYWDGGAMRGKHALL